MPEAWLHQGLVLHLEDPSMQTHGSRLWQPGFHDPSTCNSHTATRLGPRLEWSGDPKT